MNLASYLDSTNLRPEATGDDIKKLCIEAADENMVAVCIQPFRLQQAKQILRNSPVKLCTVIGFPLGADISAVKRYAVQQALEDGADEIDMVVNIGALKDGQHDVVKKEVQDILSLKKDTPFLFKLIVETALLTKEELIYVTEMLNDTEADYIKTSTGFSTRGASLEDIHIIQAHKSERLKIKASGGIRSLDFALQLIHAGANRIGTSSALKILEEFRVQGGH
ncbi:MAG: deoxyribose-phosphate aldolase [Bacillota bacterium]|nr:deoxyribose-phosphate aldolase [Bacillota bacterium]